MTTNHQPQEATMLTIATLPALGEPLENGTFAGITTKPDGNHHAVVLLPDQGTQLTWKKAMNWAQKLKAELPTRPVAALLFANIKAKLKPGWHWTSEEYDASYAWNCDFFYGSQSSSASRATKAQLLPSA